MEALRLHTVIENTGEIVVTGLPYTEGQHIELILLTQDSATSEKVRMTAEQLLNSELIGLWKNREDIADSGAYARQLREQAEKREVKR